MLDAGEMPDWLKALMGHESLKMILEPYFRILKTINLNNGSAFMESVYQNYTEQEVVPELPD